MLKLIVVIMGLFLFTSPTHAQETSAKNSIPGEVIVRFKDGYNPKDIAATVSERKERAASLTGRLENAQENISYHLAGFETPENIQKDLQTITVSYDAQAKPLPTSDQNTYIYSVDPHEPVQNVQEAFKDLPIEYVQPNYTYYLSALPNDTDYTKQWGFEKIHMQQAWNLGQGSSNVKVGIVDTGVEKTHPDLAGRVVKSQAIAPGCITDADAHGHGTHVAGVIGAVANNAQGIAGMNWNVSILGYCVIGPTGTGSSAYIASGIRAAADDGVAVINMSLGGPVTGQDFALESALEYAASKNVILVAAAGNCGNLPPGEYKQPGNESCYWGGDADKYLPGSDPHTINVAASGPQNEHPVYSNSGNSIDVSAPGGNPPTGSKSCNLSGANCIYSTWKSTSACPSGSTGQSYCSIAGTSMSAPHVTGLVALLKAAKPSLDQAAIQTILQESSLDLGQPGKDPTFGYGLIQADAALQQALGLSLSPIPLPTTSGCTDKKEHGDYDCDSKVTLLDFETWRQDFEKSISTLHYFELFRQVFAQ